MNFNFVKEILKSHPFLFQLLPEELKNNIEIILIAVRKDA